MGTDARCRELREEDRVALVLATGLADVVSVVEPDADDLARTRDRREQDNLLDREAATLVQQLTFKKVRDVRLSEF